MTPQTLLSPHQNLSPSEWITRWAHLIKENGSVLDVACGYGRHMQWLKNRNHTLVGIDNDKSALAFAANLGEVISADIENGPWPFIVNGTNPTATRQFDAVVVTNYLWRPLFPHILDSLKPKGLLLYETFAVGNESVGKPSRPEFLLKTGELLEVCKNFKIIAFEDVFLHNPARFVQRIVAMK